MCKRILTKAREFLACFKHEWKRYRAMAESGRLSSIACKRLKTRK